MIPLELTLLFTNSILYLLLLIFPLYLWGEDKDELFFYIISLFIVFSSIWLLKIFFAVPRPPGALLDLPSNAFPSMHSALGLFSLAFFFHRKKWRLPLGIYGLLIAYSRLYLKVHYLSDVLVGGLIGFSVPWIIYQYGVKFQERKER